MGQQCMGWCVMCSRLLFTSEPVGGESEPVPGHMQQQVLCENIHGQPSLFLATCSIYSTLVILAGVNCNITIKSSDTCAHILVYVLHVCIVQSNMYPQRLLFFFDWGEAMFTMG